MGQVQQRFLIGACVVSLCVPLAGARKFYDDDPVWQMPKPLDSGNLQTRKLSDFYDFFYMSFGKPGEKAEPGAPVRSRGTNTLGEVPDSEWYTNRHGRKRLSIEELVKGAGDGHAPSLDSPWKVTAAKTEGVTAGFRMQDARGRSYMLKFDTRENFELSTGADVMGSKFFHALGYFTPENYIVCFNAEQLVVEPGTRLIDNRGIEREMKQSDIVRVLAGVPRDKSGRYRAVASLLLPGKPLGPFRYHGVRADDPNDTVPHEHRRELRGLRVFSAWLNHTDSKSLNSLDTLVEENGVRFIRHHLLDYSAAFGTDAFEPKSPRAGKVHMLDWPDMTRTFFTLGLYVPAWARAEYRHVKGAGRIEAELFDPAGWKSHYYNPAFANCLPDDAFWAARQVMAFTETEIRALVATAQYTDKQASEYLVRTLVDRQRKIGEWAFSQVLPLDDIRVDNGRLAFDDLAVKYGMLGGRTYQVSWAAFDNESERSVPLDAPNCLDLPETSSRYAVATVHGGDPAVGLQIYVRDGRHVVGIERCWKQAPIPPVVSTPSRGAAIVARW